MAQTTLVELQFEDGQRLIERLIREGIAVSAAAWVKESDSGDWYLYLATPLVGEDGATRPAYHRVNMVIRDMQEKEGFGMDPFQIKVIGPHDVIAHGMTAHRHGRPGTTPTLFRGSRLGNLAVDEAFIYPRPPTQEEIAGMQLWICGGIELKPARAKNEWRCRVVVIDVEKQSVLQDNTYPGIIREPQPLTAGQIEITWAEGGTMRIITAGAGPARSQRLRWSQPRLAWEEGSCPPDDIQNAVLSAM